MQRPITSHQKKLSALCAIVGAESSSKELEKIEVSGIAQASDSVLAGDLFIALPGEKFHGAQFASDAVSRGAVAVLTDAKGAKDIKGVPVLISNNPRRAAGIASAWFYSEPMRDLYSVGVTGTNGKTTTASILGSLITTHGGSVHVMGTLTGARTTPESIDLHAQLRSCVDAGVDHVVMEVSSHALEHHRVDGIVFDVAVFTNLGHDHLDFHGTMENYFAAKRKLFTSERTRAAVVNVDDPHGHLLQTEAVVPTSSYSLSDVSNVKISASTVSLTWKNLDIRLPIGGSLQ